ncbi:MAG: FecR domain-containing protein [Pedobacter sp.]|uniref:FecR family protein n=1 Tax=Pedobacter sp. TaxID=1411316 RepID=UPI002807D801|nr:FecR domain-containing protein [Pedobacter sp.]MDQ8004583.1 FecR domain-containing protein [Pedobacter sp.]
MTSEEYIKLYQKFLEGKCNADEVRQLFDYKDDFKLVSVKEELGDEELKAKIQSRIQDELHPVRKRSVKMWYAYAAAAIILVTAGLFFFANNYNSQPSVSDKTLANADGKSIDANSNAPILTLADGSTIALDEKGSGLLTNEAGTEIRKVTNGELAYDTPEQLANNTNSLNKISIPRGSTYKVTLADGTKVWLNAASSLSYPSAFNGSERVVSLVGEAYFEVAKNAKKPFKVKMNDTEVQVLGTHFNISAYEDDNDIKTTLMEGSVKLRHLGTEKLLVPGQQAIAKEQSSDILIKKAGAQEVLAWKNGYFLFKDNSIREVMSQVARWYKLQVVYQDKIDGKHFGGIYDKSKKLEELLKGLEATGLVRFKVEEGNSSEERRVVVME